MSVRAPGRRRDPGCLFGNRWFERGVCRGGRSRGAMTDTCGARSWYKAKPFFVRYRHPLSDGFIGWLFPPSRYQIGALKTKNAPAAIKAKPIQWLSADIERIHDLRLVRSPQIHRPTPLDCGAGELVHRLHRILSGGAGEPIGSFVYTPAQLKTMQEIITLVVTAPWACWVSWSLRANATDLGGPNSNPFVRGAMLSGAPAAHAP
jgi:hypothetical protein